MLQFLAKGRLAKGEESHEAAGIHCWSDDRGRNGTGAGTADWESLPYRIRSSSAPVADQNQASKGSLAIPAIFEELLRLGYVEGRNLLIERKILPAGNAAAAAVVVTRDTTPALRLFARFGLV
jgi:hypothetical protein